MYPHSELLFLTPKGPGASQTARQIPARFPSKRLEAKRLHLHRSKQEPGKINRRSCADSRSHTAPEPPLHSQSCSSGFLSQPKKTRVEDPRPRISTLRSLKMYQREFLRARSCRSQARMWQRHWKTQAQSRNDRDLPEGPCWSSIGNVTILDNNY